MTPEEEQEQRDKLKRLKERQDAGEAEPEDDE